MGGPIEAAALCGLTALRVLALSQNLLKGELPECMANLALTWLWLDVNRIHGPVSEFSNLGQFLKDVRSLSLAANRWAPLLPDEKAALSEVAGPIGVVEGDHDWDFSFHYEWQEEAAPVDGQLTAEREVSYRHWSAGVPVQGVKIGLPFAMPHRGKFAVEIGLGRDGDFVLGSGGGGQLEWNPDPQPDTNSGWKIYVGCYKDLCSHWDQSGCGALGADPARAEGELSIKAGGLPQHSDFSWWDRLGRNRPFEDYRSECESHCSDYRYFGLQWSGGCVCGNSYGFWGEATAQSDCSTCGNGRDAGQTCGAKNAVYFNGAWALDMAVTVTTARENDCWDTMPSLVPSATAISDTDGAVSSQGAAYFAERFCPGWANYVSANTCGESEPDCDAAGNALFDGGGDMYDIGEGIACVFHF